MQKGGQGATLDIRDKEEPQDGKRHNQCCKGGALPFRRPNNRFNLSPPLPGLGDVFDCSVDKLPGWV